MLITELKTEPKKEVTAAKGLKARILTRGRRTAGTLRDLIYDIRSYKTEGIFTMRPESLKVIPPLQGWDAWYAFAYQNIPEANMLANTMAEYATGFTLSGDADVIKKLDLQLRQTDFQYNLILLGAVINYYVFGRVFFDHDFTEDRAKWIRLPDPTTIVICRNTVVGRQNVQLAGVNIRENQIMDNTGTVLYTIPKVAPKDEIIGYVQTVSSTEKNYFKPDKFIVVFRYPITGGFVDGQSIFHAVYTAGYNKIVKEANNRLISDLRLDPKKLWKVGNEDIQCPTGASGDLLINEIKTMVEAQETGEDIFVPNYVDSKPLFSGDPKLLAYSSDEYKDTRRQFIGGMGGFTAMVSGESSNRSTAATQERLFNEKVMPVRLAFEPVVRLHFEQILAAAGIEAKEIPVPVWRDVTIEISNQNRIALSRGVATGWMTVNQARAVEGLPPMKDDMMFVPLNTQPFKLTETGLEPMEIAAPPETLEAAVAARKLNPGQQKLWEKYEADTKLIEMKATAALTKILAEIQEDILKQIDELM